MIRWTPVLVALALASCKEKEPEKSPVERGAAVFSGACDTLGLSLATDLKAKNPTAYKQYLEETQTKDEASLGRRIGGQILAHYAQPLAVTDAQEKDYKAGKFDDAANKKRVNDALARFADRKMMIPEACQIAMMKVESGDWKTGLLLEFAARLLEGHFGLSKH